MRDKRKNMDYFENFLSYSSKLISKREKMILSVDEEEKISRISSTLIKDKIEYLIASFSAGEISDRLDDLLSSAVNTAVNVRDLSYSDHLVLLSLSIILNDINAGQKIAKKFNSDDKLINCLSTFILNGKIVWIGDFLFPQFDGLNISNSKNDNCDMLVKYLKNWYSSNKESYWYESHRKINDTYFGYWSFESAALAKILDLDINMLSSISEYFPVI